MQTLHGQHIVITRPTGGVADMARVLREHGATVIEYPVIKIVPASAQEQLAVARALDDRDAYHALILTSANAVQHLVDIATEHHVDLTTMQATVFAVGPKTRDALSEAGLESHTPRQSVSESLLERVLTTMGAVAGKRFLFPQARDGRDVIVRGLEAAGATVDRLPLYDTVPITDGPALPDVQRIDWITFTSPSAVHAFQATATAPQGTRIACIGPTTARVAENAGYAVAAVAKAQTIEALAQAMIAAL